MLNNPITQNICVRRRKAFYNSSKFKSKMIQESKENKSLTKPQVSSLGFQCLELRCPHPEIKRHTS